MTVSVRGRIVNRPIRGVFSVEAECFKVPDCSARWRKGVEWRRWWENWENERKLGMEGVLRCF